MRLPFVSRARYEDNDKGWTALCEQIREDGRRNDARLLDLSSRVIGEAKSWQALYEAERVRNDRLVQQLVDMKRDGFSTAAQRQAPALPIPSKIDDAINEKAGANGALRRHLTRWAAQRQAMNVAEDEIVDALTHWTDPDEVEA